MKMKFFNFSFKKLFFTMIISEGKFWNELIGTIVAEVKKKQRKIVDMIISKE